VKPELQSAALPYRRDESGRAWVCVVTTRGTHRWSIPKGSAEPHLSLAENAAKEAFEEAGLVGEIAPRASGMFRTVKRRPEGEVVIEVWVFLLEVDEALEHWPEEGQREVRWMPCRDAGELLREPLLQKLCAQLDAAA
jgi:8-oxo-dGTP pyrophosphatase MutT (NUDIX family)